MMSTRSPMSTESPRGRTPGADGVAAAPDYDEPDFHEPDFHEPGFGRPDAGDGGGPVAVGCDPGGVHAGSVPHVGDDAEFFKLVSRRRDVDLTRAALEVARDFDPDLDADAVLAWLDGRAAEARGAVAAAESERDALAALADVLCGRHGLCGEDAAFDRPESSYLPHVIDCGRGLPITLSLIYMAVAERVGLALAGVSAPLHFLTRLDTPAGPLFQDPFHGGRVRTEPETLAWLTARTGLDDDALRASLRPATPRAIVVRLLNNLKSQFIDRDDWSRAWCVQHRLAALQPDAYRERRDLALIALHAGRPGQALDLFESCLPLAPEAERDLLVRHRARARRQLCRWN